jgi:thiol-disulfide isomerase/thioredoxin
VKALPGRMLFRVALVLASLVGGAVPHLSAQSRVIPAADSALIADASWMWRTLDGRTRDVGSFRGSVLIVNSWATWCEPCVAELQSLDALRRAMPDTALKIALVAAQRREPVAAFVRRRQLALPVYLEVTLAPSVYNFSVVPTTWIIDQRGRIVLRHRGARDWNTPSVRAMLRELLGSGDGTHAR